MALNGIPILGGPKLFTRKAADTTVADRGLYDVAHFFVVQLQIASGLPIPPWGEPLVLRRPIGNGLFVTTTVTLPPDEDPPAVAAAATPPAANDEAA